MKGQSSIEMIIMVGIVLIFFGISFAWYINSNIDIIKSSEILKAKELCREVGDVINNVIATGMNTVDKFTLPSRLDSTNYNLTIFAPSRVVHVAVKGAGIYCSVLTTNVTNGTNSIFELKPGNYKAKNMNGVVNIRAI